MPRLVNSLQFRLTAGFAIVLALSIAGVSAFSAAATQRETRDFAAQVEAARTERAEILVQNAYQANQDWSEVQLAVSQVGGLFGWRVVVTDVDGYVVADSHQFVITTTGQPEHIDDSRVQSQNIRRRPIIIGNRIVGEMLMDPVAGRDQPALAVTEFGAELFEAFGLPVSGNPNVFTRSELDRFTRSSQGGRIPSEFLQDTNQAREQQVAEEVLSELDSLLIEPPLSDLEESFRRSLILAGLAAMAAGLIFVTFFTRQALSPVRGLTSAARKLGSGDLTYRVPEDRNDEIGELATTFNEMATDLESAEMQRRRMTADIAHELRTPLTNIQGYLEAILDGVVKPDPETISSLHSQTVHLSRLVDDLRLLSVAEAGALRLETTPDDLGSVIRETATSFEPRASELDITLDVSIEDGLPTVALDRTRMRQVLANLIENAFQHNHQGGNVSVVVEREGPASVAFSVSDTGAGIPADQLDKIFDQFYRIDPSRNRATGGVGLGLTIVKRLVEAHGGQLSVSSTPGEGTSFRVILPSAESNGAG